MSKTNRSKQQKKQPVEHIKTLAHTTVTKSSTILIYIFIALAFSFAARLYWYFYALGEPTFLLNSQVMINTNDGYYYAEGARDLIAGHHEAGDRSAVAEPVAIVTALVANLIPFASFETIILFMPALLGSLIVIPMVLIGKTLDKPTLGFLAAIIGSVTYSYYNRTMTGYYDSDMLALPIPMFVLYFLIESIKNRGLFAEIGLVVSLVLCVWGYPQSFTLMLGTVGLAAIYCIILERSRRDIFMLLAFCFIAISQLDITLKLPLVILLVIGLKYKNELFNKAFWFVLLVAVGVFAYFGGFEIMFNSFRAYLLKNSLEVKSSFKYFDVVQTVREAGHIDFNVFAQRISGSIVAFFMALAGLILLLKERRLFLLSLPMVALGFLAMKAGLRFTVYAVPVMAFGYIYLAMFLSKNLSSPVKQIVIGLFVLFSLVPNLGHIYGYKSTTVYSTSEAQATLDLGKMANREDYVYTWWDYGYPVRYYADVKNHSDGGKHDGATNYIESTILCATNQRLAANMMREATEKYEEMLSKKLDQNISTFEYMLKSAKVEQKDYEQYLQALSSKEFATTKKSRDVYLYLPHQMFEILTTIKQFSNVNLITGEQTGEHFMNFYEGTEEREDGIYYSNQKIVDKKNMKVQISNNHVSIGKYSIAGYDKNNKLIKNEKNINANGTLHVLSLPNLGGVLIADDEMYNSLYVQIFLLENYDRTLFEPMIMKPDLKIFKLKI